MTTGTRASVKATLSLVAFGLAVAGLGGCHKGDGPTAAQMRTSAAKKAAAQNDSGADAALAEAKARMVSGVPVGTVNTAPVDVRFDLPAAPAPGEAFDVNLAVLPEVATPVLRVEVSGSDGLVVTDPSAPATFEKVQAGTVERVAVKAVSAAAGTRVLTVKATLDLPTGPELRSFAFPVIIGVPPPPAKPGTR